MGKERKKTARWMVFLRGSLLALGIYVLGILLLALLMVKGTLPESGAFPVLAVLCVLSVLCGGLLTVRGSPWGTLPAGFLTATIFCGILIAVGACFWQGISLTGRGGVLLLCALAGGVLAALLGCRKRHTGKRIRKSFVL